MNALRSIARDLVDKRLWPVALLLVAGIVGALGVAVTAGGGADAPAAAQSAVPGRAASAVTMAQDSQLGDQRPLSGEGNDPFRRGASPSAGEAPASVAGPLGAVAPAGGLPAGEPVPAGADIPLPAGGGSTPGSGVAGGSVKGGGGTSGSVEGGGGTSTGSGGGDSSPTSPKPRKKPEYTFYEVDVKMVSDRGDTRVRTDVARLTPMPGATNPLVLFFGVFNEGDSAGFLIREGVRVRGSNCSKVPARSCSLLRLRESRSARITVGGRSHLLTVEAIRRVTTRDEDAARRAFQRRSSVGRCLLEADGGYGMLVFDPRSGTYQAGGDPEDCTRGEGGDSAGAAQWDLVRRWRSVLGL